MNESLYNELNKGWKTTCKVILGEDLGELSEYKDWLSEYLPTVNTTKSHLSGEPVVSAMADYCQDAKFVSAKEIRDISASLNINEIKDIDSILNAISEKWEYSGNHVFGKSTLVEASDSIVNSHYVYKGLDLVDCSHSYLSSTMQGSKHAYGARGYFQGEFAIAYTRGTRVNRTICSNLATECSDLYFSANAVACHDLMFSFNQRNKRNMVGNMELPRDRYSELKKKLLREVIDEIKKNKRFPSVVELVPNTVPGTKLDVEPSQIKKSSDMQAIDKAFSSTSRVLLKKELGQLSEYEQWLSRHTSPPKELKSPFGYDVLFSALMAPMDEKMPLNRLVSMEEAEELGKLKLDESDISTLEKIRTALSKIGFITTEIIFGSNSNVIKSPIMFNDKDIYRVDRGLTLESSGVGYLITGSKFIFGSTKVSLSQFCMNCYYSTRLTRCFEIDASSDCTDAYFCHNSENLQEAMFCFNTKSKRYAIGNNQLPPDKYRSIKESVLTQVSDELVRNKNLNYDVFNIGCWKK